MTVPEARRHDLYNGLEEVLGTDRADTLMAYLPTTEAAALATRSDLGAVRADIDDIRAEVVGIRTEIEAVNHRLDRLFLTLAAGLLAVVGSLVVPVVVG